ncbi:unnamed protein product [Lampetra planeri]
MAALESPADASPTAGQRCATRLADPSPSEDRWAASARLAELLGTAADLVAKLDIEELSTEELAPGPRGNGAVAAAVRPRESPATPPDRAADILVGTCSGEATISRQPRRGMSMRCTADSRSCANSRRLAGIGRRLKRRFSASCTLVGRTEEEALKALPNSLDDDALAAFCAILPARHSTLVLAFKEMAAVYDPPSCVHNRFVERQRGETETLLCCKKRPFVAGSGDVPEDGGGGHRLLGVGQAMDKLLGLAKELNVTLPASEEDDPTSLVIARCIQSHLGLKKCSGLIACAAPADRLHSQRLLQLQAARTRRCGVPGAAPWTLRATVHVFSSTINCKGSPGESRCTTHSALVPTSPIF